jgi:hypothetical protein
MSYNGARLSALGVALLLVAGCGGGSNTGSNSGGSGGGTGGSGGGNGGGNGGGSGDQPTTVTFTFISGAPTQLAVKVGSGNYTAATLTSNKLTISIPSGTTTYSIAYLCPPAPNSNSFEQENIQFDSIEDGTTASGACFAPSNDTPAMGDLTGTVNANAFPAAAGMQVAILSPSGYQQIGLEQPLGSFDVSGPSGSDRVLIGLYDSSTVNLLAIKNFSSQAVPGTLNTVTFSLSDAPTPQPITFANLPNGFSTPYGTVFAVHNLMILAFGPLSQYPQLPAGVLQDGDYYSIGVTSSPSSASRNPSVIGTVQYPTGGGPVTLTFPAPWSTAGPTVASLPTFNYDYTGFAGKSNLYVVSSITWTASNGHPESVQVSATQGYLGSANTLAIPDLSGVGGFLTPPTSGTTVSWSEEIHQSTFAFTDSPANGASNYVTNQGDLHDAVILE